MDVLGKLGPLAVAVAVFLTGQRQSRWLNQATVRTALVEDQKLRLALLDRRLKVLEHLRVARDKLLVAGSADAVGGVLDALREAELIFEDREREQLQSCLDMVVHYQSRYLGRLEILVGDEMMQAVQQYTDCNRHIGVVLEQLRRAARVQDVAPLKLPA